MGWESTRTGSTQDDRGEEDNKVNVLRNLTVVPHEASVDVPAAGKGRPAANQVLETSTNLATVVEDGMGDGSGVNGEPHAVDEGVASGEVSRRVSLVTLLVEHGILVDNFRDIVTGTGVGPNVVIVDREVSGIPGVGIPNREDDRGGDERAKETVKDTPEGVDEGVSIGGKLIPVPCGDGVEAKTATAASNRSQDDIIRGNPGNPVEIGHNLDEIVGEPEVDKHGAEAV